MLSKSKNFNINYAARIVEIKDFYSHSNPKVERLKCCKVAGYNIITGIDSEPGFYIYFPTGCQVDKEFLRLNNQFRDPELNDNPEKTGMFEKSGRVKAINLLGEKSEGFIIPKDSLIPYLGTLDISLLVDEINVDFDTICEKQLCKKYIPKDTQRVSNGSNKKSGKKSKADLIVEGQFAFHIDTTQLQRCPHVIKPDSVISITEKVHGTSAISSYILLKNPTKRGRVATFFYNLFSKDKLQREEDNPEYGYLWSSRKVIKSLTDDLGYYNADVWGVAHKVLEPYLSKGMTIYYEIIGFTPTGGYIQKGYDYGFEAPTDNNYEYGKHFGIQIYRITETNVDGVVHEYSARQVQQWCEKYNLPAVTLYYYGYAGDLYPELDPYNHWNENFLQRLQEDSKFYMEMNSPTCNNKVPHEGIVVRNETLGIEVYKVKCHKFLIKESEQLSKGIIDIETAEELDV